ncbi:MAG: biopolymer transporter ExbD [Bacteroidetes bacterium]|nr:biopolymer transporter ExbD [Bacteroidota bacterium]
MAEVNTGDSGGDHGKKGKKRAKKSSTRIDMTPMVDLAFLLLTFFILTSTFSKPKTMEINFPAEPKDESERQKVNNALTFILTKESKAFYYYGEFISKDNKDGKPATQIIKTDFSKDGIHKLLLEYNKKTRDEIAKLEDQYKKKQIADTTYKRLAIKAKGDKAALTVLIKADDKAIYKNVIDLIDELNICLVGKYAVVDMMPAELELLQAAAN